MIIESIRIHGVDCWYIPRALGSVDDLLNEDDTSSFNAAYMLEMYIKNVEGFEGDGNFLSKFGLEIRDSMTLTIAMRKFIEEVGQYNEEIRPKEGDLIYFPLNRKIFEIMYVDNKPVFYQLGSLQMYDLRCELFEYSNEVFNTGVAEIDAVFEGRNTTSTAANTLEGLEAIDPLADNFTIQVTANTVLDWTEDNPFGSDEY